MASSRQSLVKTACGHRVKSQSEKKVDDWLFKNGWLSIYEPKVSLSKGNIAEPDWVLLPQNGICKPVIVEYWGLSVLKKNAAYWAKQAQPKYQERRKRKEELYRSNPHFHYIGLEMPDLKKLDERLGRVLESLKCETEGKCECIHIVESLPIDDER